VAPVPATDTKTAPIPSAKPPLKERLLAWWEGYELVPRAGRGKPAAEPARGPSGPIVMPEAVSGWPAHRIAAAQLMFGEDFTWPGESEALDQLFKPLGLNEKMSVLELGAGLGGGARLMAKKYGAWVSALERDAGLATAGNALSTKHGLARKAPVTFADYLNLPVREKTIDAIVARQALSTVEDKDALIGKLVSLFKPAGQLLIADMTLADPSAAADPAFEAWRASEPTPVELWDAGRMRSAIEKRGLEVRVTEDMTPSFRAQVLGGFAASAGLLADKDVDPTLKGWILWETELWARRVAMMDKGLIACHRIYATVVLKA
jgi:ubiquinone/menaquinone biosynthesis C-methylase UbiE